ncbi:MAG: AmmeMemoRadiSam system protein B [Acidobacteriales bacterium]|nr:AmmeMemoRadiSam system protein B [Terriglobales bacterium]
MARILPRLRMDLEFLPSPVPDRPGLLIRDPYRYSTTTLIIPPVLVECLRLFDAQSSDLDLHQFLVRLTGDVRAGEAGESLARALADAAFLEDETYEAARSKCRREFAEASVREPAHAGESYPEDAGELRQMLDAYLDGASPRGGQAQPLTGIAAPHASFDGASECYRAAYSALSPEYRDKIFVILGTSHAGAPDRLGLTRKPFVTPLGTAATESGLVERLAADCGSGVELEDYCHSTEHSIEFQVLFLQHLFGAGVRILPILVGPFSHGLIEDGMPEDAPEVQRVLEAMGGLAEREAERLFWVLGIDLAHMGPRYGDEFAIQATEEPARQVEARDHARLDRVCAGDAAAFWRDLSAPRDDLKWCGASSLYLFLKAVPRARAAVAAYQQWNIDGESMVSCAALHFRTGS